jgi:energy-coupling factor transporter transmembrane protein EcfT
VGIVNAAIWLGAGVFFALFILPGVFSGTMHTALKLSADPSTNYYQGAIAQVLFHRFFALQYICAIVALLHFVTEKLYLGRAFSALGLAVVIGIFILSLAGGVVLQPKMERLHGIHYSNAPAAEKEQAAKTFTTWHGISQIANLAIMAGLVVHLVRVTRPDDSSRTITFNKFWG